MTEESMPIIGLRERIPSPIGHFCVNKNDPDPWITVIGLTPDVPIALRILARASRFLEPRMLVGGVIQNQFDDDPHPSIVSCGEERLEIFKRAIAWVDGGVVRNVVTVVSQRRGKERQQPDGIDPQLLQIVQLLHEAREVSNTVAIAVAESSHVQLVNDCIFVPETFRGRCHCSTLLSQVHNHMSVTRSSRNLALYALVAAV